MVSLCVVIHPLAPILRERWARGNHSQSNTDTISCFTIYGVFSRIFPFDSHNSLDRSVDAVLCSLLHTPSSTLPSPPPHPSRATSDQEQQSQSRCTGPDNHPQEHLSLPRLLQQAGRAPSGVWGGNMNGVCLLPHHPSDGGEAGTERPWLPLMQLLSLGKSFFLFPKLKPTSQLKPEKAESICRPRDYIDRSPHNTAWFALIQFQFYSNAFECRIGKVTF